MEQPIHEAGLDVDLTGADLTLNERIAIEDVCGGVPFEVLRDEGRSTFLRAVAWVVGRRHDPRLTLDQAGELRVSFDG
jgi:hypothetical protein